MNLENIRKIFVLGDLHLGVRNNSKDWSDIQSEFLLDFFLKKVDEEGFDPERDILVQLGDWNHVRESTNTRIYKISLKIAETFSKKFKRGVFVILGNHDVYYKDRTDTHSLEGFTLMYPNFHVFESAEILKINSTKFLMLPWIEDVQVLKETANVYSSADYVFCHADVKGFNLNRVTTLEHGFDYADLAKFKRVYSGHIHIRQDKNNVLYVGTPYEMDRGDRGNSKGFYILEMKDSELTEKFVENSVSPKHVKFDILTILNKSSLEIKELFKNNFVDISIESSFSSRFPIARFTELVKEFGHRRLEFISYSTDLVKSKSEIEIDSNYEYNLFNILEDRLTEMNIAKYKSDQIFSKFKEIYDSLRNSKQYE